MPEEGCALLLGTASAGRIWQLNQVWPCCNVWDPVTERRHRFALDPREQLAAQRWARERGERVIGVAHGHPGSDPMPSDVDCRLGTVETLMVICGGDGQLQAWWLRSDRRVMAVPIAVWDTLEGELRSVAPA